MCCTARPETIGWYGNAEFSLKGLGTEVFVTVLCKIKSLNSYQAVQDFK